MLIEKYLHGKVYNFHQYMPDWKTNTSYIDELVKNKILLDIQFYVNLVENMPETFRSIFHKHVYEFVKDKPRATTPIALKKNDMFKIFLKHVSLLPLECVLNKKYRTIVWELFFKIDDAKNLIEDNEADFNKMDSLFILKDLLFENMHANYFENTDNPDLEMIFSSQYVHYNLPADFMCHKLTHAREPVYMKAMNSRTKFFFPLSVIKFEDVENPDTLVNHLKMKRGKDNDVYFTPESYNRLKYLLFSIPGILKRYKKLNDKRILMEIFMHFVFKTIVKPGKDYMDSKREWNKSASDFQSENVRKLFQFFSKHFGSLEKIGHINNYLHLTKEKLKIQPNIQERNFKLFLAFACIFDLANNDKGGFQKLFDVFK